jgi:hypothetical protein
MQAASLSSDGVVPNGKERPARGQLFRESHGAGPHSIKRVPSCVSRDGTFHQVGVPLARRINSPRPLTARARPGRLSTLSVLHQKSVLYGAYAWARRALNRPFRRFLDRADRQESGQTAADWADHGGRGGGRRGGCHYDLEK